MDIYGVDFTSAPRKRKPITLARCRLTDGVLCVDALDALPTFADFEAFLQGGGAWVAGMDFPFGQPRKLIENLNFPRTWAGYVELIAAMGKNEWVDTVKAYMALRQKGDKLHFRVTDRVAGAQSPMKMSFIPVGRMFYEGAPRLLNSPVSIPPVRPTDDPRAVLEVYPALVARKFAGRGSGYKSDDKDQQTERAAATRQTILDGLRMECRDAYGFDLRLSDSIEAALVDDPTGDKLDAVLCAVQAGWAHTQDNYGIPPGADPLEGWIIDPDLFEKYIAGK
jgi:hypothetical protein